MISSASYCDESIISTGIMSCSMFCSNSYYLFYYSSRLLLASSCLFINSRLKKLTWSRQVIREQKNSSVSSSFSYLILSNSECRFALFSKSKITGSSSMSMRRLIALCILPLKYVSKPPCLS